MKQERRWSPKGAGSQRQGFGVVSRPLPPFPKNDYVTHTAIYAAKLLSVVYRTVADKCKPPSPNSWGSATAGIGGRRCAPSKRGNFEIKTLFLLSSTVGCFARQENYALYTSIISGLKLMQPKLPRGAPMSDYWMHHHMCVAIHSYVTSFQQ